MNANAKVTLITAANKGLGLEIARQLTQNGCTVLLSACELTRGTEVAETLKVLGDVRVSKSTSGCIVNISSNLGSAAQWTAEFRKSVIPAEAIARAIAFVIEQPEDVDVNEIVVRAIGQSG